MLAWSWSALSTFRPLSSRPCCASELHYSDQQCFYQTFKYSVWTIQYDLPKKLKKHWHWRNDPHLTRSTSMYVMSKAQQTLKKWYSQREKCCLPQILRLQAFHRGENWQKKSGQRNKKHVKGSLYFHSQDVAIKVLGMGFGWKRVRSETVQ